MSRNKTEGVYLGRMWNKHERAGKLYLCKPQRRVISCLNGPNNRKQRKAMQRYLKTLDE